MLRQARDREKGKEVVTHTPSAVVTEKVRSATWTVLRGRGQETKGAELDVPICGSVCADVELDSYHET